MAREAYDQAITTEIPPEAKKLDQKFEPLGPDSFEPIHYACRSKEMRSYLVDMVIKQVQKYEPSEGQSSDFLDVLTECEHMYSMNPWYKKPRYKELSNVANPLIFIAIEHNVDRVMDVTFGVPDGPAQVLPDNQRDEEERKVTLDAQGALNKRLSMLSDTRQTHENIIRTCLKFGDSWSKQVWMVRRSVRYEREEIMTPFGPMIDETEKISITDEGPIMVWVDSKDIIFPTNVKDPLEAPWLCHRYWLTPEEIRLRMVGDDPEFEPRRVEEQPTEAPRPEGDMARKEALARTPTTNETGFKKLYEQHIKWKSPVDDLPSDWIFTVNVTDKVLLRAVRSIFEEWKPFARYTPIPIEGKPRGRPLPKVLEPDWKYINTTVDQVIDIGSYAAGPGGSADPATGLTQNPKGLAPNKFVVGRGIAKDAVNFYNPPDVSKGLSMTLQILLDWFEKLTGLTEAELGRFPAGVERPTARGTTQLLGKTAIKFEKLNGNIQDGLARAYYQMLWMMVNIGGESYFSRFFDPETASGIVQRMKKMKWDIKVLGNPISADKGQRKREAEHLFTLLAPIGEIAPDLYAELVNYLIRAFEARDLEPIIHSLKEKLALAQQAGVVPPVGAPLAETPLGGVAI